MGIKEIEDRIGTCPYRYSLGAMIYVFTQLDGDGLLRGRLVHMMMTPAGLFLFEV